MFTFIWKEVVDVIKIGRFAQCHKASHFFRVIRAALLMPRQTLYRLAQRRRLQRSLSSKLLRFLIIAKDRVRYSSKACLLRYTNFFSYIHFNSLIFQIDVFFHRFFTSELL